MEKNHKLRLNYFIGFLLSAALLGLTFFLQFYSGMAPCTLCILQRAALAGLSILFLIGTLFYFKKIAHVFLCLLGASVALIGMIFSGRQVWLQHFPAHGLGDCTISLRYLFKIFSFTDALQQIWRGGVECSERAQEIFYLSIAEWSLIWFILFFIIFIVQMVLLKKSQR